MRYFISLFSSAQGRDLGVTPQSQQNFTLLTKGIRVPWLQMTLFSLTSTQTPIHSSLSLTTPANQSACTALLCPGFRALFEWVISEPPARITFPQLLLSPADFTRGGSCPDSPFILGLRAED